MTENKDTITVKEFEFVDISSEAGGHAISWKCPDCGEEVSYAPCMWWNLECRCREWELIIKANGEKKRTIAHH